MRRKLIEIFRVGTFTPMSGESLTFSDRDLETTAVVYNNDRATDAPLVLGHPKDDGPALGFVKSLVKQGRTLFADAEFSDRLVDLIKAGRYNPRSAAFYRPKDPRNPVPGSWFLRHVGFLGAASPAVKGLSDVAFAGGEDAPCFAQGGLASDAMFDMESPLLDVCFAAGQKGNSTRQVQGRQALHEASLKLCTIHPDFSYLDAAKYLERHPSFRVS